MTKKKTKELKKGELADNTYMEKHTVIYEGQKWVIDLPNRSFEIEENGKLRPATSKDGDLLEVLMYGHTLNGFLKALNDDYKEGKISKADYERRSKKLQIAIDSPK